MIAPRRTAIRAGWISAFDGTVSDYKAELLKYVVDALGLVEIWESVRRRAAEG